MERGGPSRRKMDDRGLYYPDEGGRRQLEDLSDNPPPDEGTMEDAPNAYKYPKYDYLKPAKPPDVLGPNLANETVEVRDTGNENVGRGLYARKDIDAGDDIFEFDGIRRGEKKGLATAMDGFSAHAITVGSNKKHPHYFVYAAPNKHSPLRYLNHSCNPNAARKPGDMFGFVALRPIAAEEEITADYSLLEANPYWKLENCGCGAENCRHEIGDVSSLPLQSLAEHWHRLTPEMQEFAIRYSRDSDIAKIRSQMGTEYMFSGEHRRFVPKHSPEEILTSIHPTIVNERNYWGAKQLAPHFLEIFASHHIEEPDQQQTELAA